MLSVFPVVSQTRTISEFQVLLVMNYSGDIPWNRNFLRSFKQHFQASYPDASIFVEYIDENRITTPEAKAAMLEMLRIKYQNKRIDYAFFDGVNLQDYAEDFRRILPNILTTMSAINDDEYLLREEGYSVLNTRSEYPAFISEVAGITGFNDFIIIAQDNIQNPVENMSTLKTKLNRISRYDIAFYHFTTLEKAIKDLNSIAANKNIIFTPVFTYDPEPYRSPAEISKILSENIMQPVFVKWSTLIVGDVVGGYVFSAEHLGKTIAEYAISTVSEASIPKSANADLQHIFNHIGMQKFGITVKDLPKGSTIINQNLSFFDGRNEAVYLFMFLASCGGLYLLMQVGLRWKIARNNRQLVFNQDLQRKVNNRLARAIETTNIGIWEYDFASRTIYWDRKMCQLHNYASDSGNLNFEDWMKLVYWEDRAEFEYAILHALNNESSVNVEYRVATLDDDDQTYITIAARRQFTDTRFAEKLVGTGLDTTERYLRAQSLEDARVKAENATRMKTEFLASFSHEIRTPLTAIIGAVDLISHTKLDNDQTKYIKIIGVSSRRLLKLLTSILEMAKMETKTFKIIKAEFDPNKMLNSLIGTCTEKANEKGLSVNVTYHDDIPFTLLGDEERIQEVLSSILTNAWEYTESGEISIDIRFNVTNNRGILMVLVRDTGPGIPDEILETVFSSLDHIHNHTADANKGVGLGLTLASNICEQMHATLAIQNRPNGGCEACFEIALELASRQIEHTGELLNKQPNLSNKKILVVDDSEIMRLISGEHLLACGADVAYAKNGREACDQYRQQKFDLILMDVMMPVMSGLQAVEKIREYETHSELDAVPIIGLSANSADEESQYCLAAGMNEYLIKPVEKDTLYKAINRCLQTS